jgi:NTP pyrophosphatase (non-canonical NTP hydrolase)
MPSQFEELTATLKAFVDERDWQQFHTPKNLVMALCGEVGELTEHFQWLTQEESASLPAAKLSEVADEIADVQFYLLLLARGLGIDVPAAVARKLRANEEKYPAALVRGSARKYTEY